MKRNTVTTAILGGSGFIGHYILIELLKEERDILVLDIKRPAIESNKIKFINVNNFGNEDYLNCLKNVSEIIDLVYTSNPKTSFDDPVKDIKENLETTTNIFRIALQLPQLTKFVYASSGGTVYGNSTSTMIDECHPTNPVSPYGITKLALEKYGLMYHHSNNLPIVIARPSNAYGFGQRFNTGQGFIAQSIYSILNDQPITIFGEKGTVRDYIHASDISKGIISLLKNSSSGQIYNIGTGIGKSNLDIVDLLKPIAHLHNKEVKVTFNEERAFDVSSNILDCHKINLQNGWEAQITIEDGLEKTFEQITKSII